MKKQKTKKVEIPRPKVNVDLEHLSINLVSLDKVKLYVNEIENLPWLSAFLFLFLGIFIERIMIGDFNLSDAKTSILLIVSVVFLILTIKQYRAKRKAWENVEKSKIDVKDNS